MLQDDGNRTWRVGSGGLHPDQHATIGGDRQVYSHLDAAQGSPQDDALAVELDNAHALISGVVCVLEAQRQSEGVEPPSGGEVERL
jgi:hypothetical protein